ISRPPRERPLRSPLPLPARRAGRSGAGSLRRARSGGGRRRRSLSGFVSGGAAGRSRASSLRSRSAPRVASNKGSRRARSFRRLAPMPRPLGLATRASPQEATAGRLRAGYWRSGRRGFYFGLGEDRLKLRDARATVGARTQDRADFSDAGE